MRIALFYQSFVSCWNNGNAHFLRGIARELACLGHEVTVWEPCDGWSRTNAVADGGANVLVAAAKLFPGVGLRTYDIRRLDIHEAIGDADLVIVHEWNDPLLISAIGRRRANGGRFTLLFHDTHHRAITAPEEIWSLALGSYDGVLAFGHVLREVYDSHGWGARAFTWHEAADTSLFHPLPEIEKDTDLVWIGNWGDGERSEELTQYLLEPVALLGLSARVHGVRYPNHARELLAKRGLHYGGWLPNHLAPLALARARATVHVPRRPYVEALPGIPTIRVFEALACGVPLVCAPWEDTEGLFPPGSYLQVRDGGEMAAALALVIADGDLAASFASAGQKAIAERHSCAQRVRELISIVAHIEGRPILASTRSSGAGRREVAA